MARNRKNLCGIALLSCIAIALLFFASSYSEKKLTDCSHELVQKVHLDRPLRSDPLAYIPTNTVRLWSKREFLVVFGVPSLDLEKRRMRRHMQRITCWQFPGVATRQNRYNGSLLALYLLARHPMNGYVLSKGVLQEAEQWHDVLLHPLNEGRSATNKTADGKGYWGIEAEVGSSRKTFFWFKFALSQFPSVPYIAKCDDDAFLRVPQYLADLRRLPRRRIYWGAYTWSRESIDEKGTKALVRFVPGYCFALARDAALKFASYKPLEDLVWTPYTKKLEPKFLAMNMDHEDVMVGRVLALTKYRYIMIADNFQRFHISPRKEVKDFVLVTHNPKPHEYYLYMWAFTLNATTPYATRLVKLSPRFFKVVYPI